MCLRGHRITSSLMDNGFSKNKGKWVPPWSGSSIRQGLPVWHPRTRRMGEQRSAQPTQLPRGPRPGSARARPAGQTLNQRSDWEFSMAVACVAGTKAQRTPTATSCNDPEQRQRVPPTHGGVLICSQTMALQNLQQRVTPRTIRGQAAEIRDPAQSLHSPGPKNAAGWMIWD